MDRGDKMKKNKIRIANAMRIHDTGYYASYPSKKFDLFKRPTGINCSDEVCPGSNERSRKIRELMKPTPYTDFMETYSKIIKEFHDLLLEEMMALTGWSESKANQWFDHYVDVNHVEIKYNDTLGDYLIFQPVLLPESKYQGVF